MTACWSEGRSEPLNERVVGEFGGELDGSDALIGISSGADRVTVLVSDNTAVSEWFITDEPTEELRLTSTGGASAELDLTPEVVTGTVTLADGTRRGFSAEPQATPAISRAQAVADDDLLLAGWVTLADRSAGTVRIQPLTGGQSTVAPAPPIPDTSFVALPGPSNPIAMLAPVTTDAPSVTPNRPFRFLVAGIGDSYASGEGNPVTAPDSRDERPGNLATMWGSEHGSPGCHRSDDAALPKALSKLGQRYPSFDMDLVFVACSGSRIEHVTGRPPGNLPLEGEPDAWGPGERGDADDERPDRWVGISEPDQPPQLQQVDELIEDEHGDQGIDVLAMSIGGNDAGFATVVGECVGGGIPENIDGIDPQAEAIKAMNKPSCASSKHRLAGALDDDGLDPVVPDGEDDPAEYHRLRLRVPGWTEVLDRYAALDATLERFNTKHRPIGRVLITQYGAGLRDDDGTFCGGRSGETKGDLFGYIDSNEAAWLDEHLLTALNQRVDIAAYRANQGTRLPHWTVVDSHVAEFAAHGPCADKPFTHMNTTALVAEGNNLPDWPFDSDLTRVKLAALHVALQSATGAAIGCGVGAIVAGPGLATPLLCAVGVGVGGAAGGIVGATTSAEASAVSAGMAHPTDAGWTAISDALVPELDAAFEDTFTPMPADRLRQHDAVRDGQVVLRWDDRSSTESRYEIKVFDDDDPTRPIHTVSILPANATEYTFIPPGRGRGPRPFVGTFTVRACNDAFCSPFMPPAKFTNIAPRTPIDVSAFIMTYNPLVGGSLSELIVDGQDPRNADMATRIELERISSATGEAVDDGPVVFDSPGPFPSGFTVGGPNGLAPGTYRVRAASCNALGCSDFSAPVTTVEVPAGPPTLAVPQPPFFTDRLGINRPREELPWLDAPATRPPGFDTDPALPTDGQDPTRQPDPFG